VFCRSNGGDVGKIIAAPSVIRIVGNSRGPVAIPSDEVAAIQRIVQARLSAEPCEFLQQGDQVHIELGPLRGTHGVVVMIKKHHRLVVSIPLLQRSVTVEIESDWLSIPWDARSSLNRSATPSGE
jgi:transcription antitermination factor NusG